MKLRRVPMLVFLTLVVLLAMLMGGPMDSPGIGGDGEDGGDGSERFPQFIVREVDKEHDLLDVDPGHDSRVDLTLSRCLAIESNLDDGEVGVAFQLLDEAAGQDVPETVQSRWEQTRLRANRALGQAVNQLLSEIGKGQILTARKRLGLLLQPASKTLRARLAAVVSKRRWLLWPDKERGGTVQLAAGTRPATFARDRLVRVPHQGEIVEGRVWQHEGGRVTVRLQNRQGVTFPVFGREALEPVQPSFAEACQQLRACYRAGELWTAWLWLCHAGSRPEARDHDAELAQMRGLVSPPR